MDPLSTLLNFFSNYFSTLIIGLIFIVALYRYGSRKRRMLERAFPGMPGPKPVFLLGHVLDLIKVKGQVHKLNDLYYSEYGKLFAMDFFDTPALVVSDPEMIKEIFVKKFDCFHERTVSSRYFVFILRGITNDLSFLIDDEEL